MVNSLDALDGPGRDAIVARLIALQKAMRLPAGLFAKRCKVTPQALSNYRTGTRRPSIDQAGKIAAGTGTSVDWILYGERKDFLPSYIYQRIYEPEP